MNLNAIGNNLAGIRMPQADPRERVQQERTPAATTPAAATQVRAPAVKEAGQAGTAVPVEAPEGTDPALWSVLTSDERAFFAKVGAMGPLTYGYVLSQGRSDPPIARGGRLDIRV
ncbi:MAG TPA: hypothetical protein VFL93_00660 [Longimicrobiaceae bacterium]|nr:hypothetical protein [Longimicrobiaceae bacterium]